MIVTKTVDMYHLQLRDTFLGREIIDYLDLSSPWTTESLLSFFEMQAKAKDAMSAPHVTLPTETRTTKLSTPMQQFIGEQVIAGSPSAVIRAEVQRLYGVTVSPSHMSHLRNRLVANKKGFSL